MKLIKGILILALIALVGIQFVRPERNTGSYESLSAFEADTRPSQQVRALLTSACYDCHSNKTNYPWYAEVAPVSFWLRDHVNDGKRHLNFSDWDKYSTKKKDHKLEELIEMVEAGEMPLKSYTLIHQDANLSPQQKEIMLFWAKTARLNYGLKAVRPK